jgi:ABC-2 type transport system permease protein
MTLASICWHNILASIRGEMQYRVSFLIQLVFGFAFQTIGFIFVAVVLTRFTAVGGWGLWEVGLLYGIRLAGHGLWVVSVNQLFRFDWIIQEGEWDRFLIRPMPLWAQLMFTQFRIAPLGDLLSGVALLTIAASRVDLDWTLGKAAFLLLAVVGGALIDGTFQLGAAAFAFRFLETLPMRIVFDDLQGRFASYPMGIFERPLRAFMTWIVPMAFMAWLPATVLLGRTAELPFPAWAAWLSPLVGFVLMAGAVCLFWTMSRQYQSAGH